MDGPNNGIVFYHYSYSPFAQRILWYLALRGIDYAQCIQPPVMPRPDLEKIGVKYRRIPIMAIGRDVYCDSRLILKKLEQLFPDGALGAVQPEERALERLLGRWMIEGGVFSRASQLIPTSTPLLKDPNFVRDREEFSGRSWKREQIEAMRPESVVHLQDAFSLLEETLLADGRRWILKTTKPSLADIEAIWVFDWLHGLKNALPRETISETQYPKVFAWIQRFNETIAKARSATSKPITLKGDEAAERILAARYAEKYTGMDDQNVLNLRRGDDVEVWPIDTGFRHRDRGHIVGLNDEEIVLETPPPNAGDEATRLHFPRINYRVSALQAHAGSAKL